MRMPIDHMYGLKSLRLSVRLSNIFVWKWNPFVLSIVRWFLGCKQGSYACFLRWLSPYDDLWFGGVTKGDFVVVCIIFVNSEKWQRTHLGGFGNGQVNPENLHIPSYIARYVQAHRYVCIYTGTDKSAFVACVCPNKMYMFAYYYIHINLREEVHVWVSTQQYV